MISRINPLNRRKKEEYLIILEHSKKLKRLEQYLI